jgi:hypothetical protein
MARRAVVAVLPSIRGSRNQLMSGAASAMTSAPTAKEIPAQVGTVGLVQVWGVITVDNTGPPGPSVVLKLPEEQV